MRRAFMNGGGGLLYESRLFRISSVRRLLDGPRSLCGSCNSKYSSTPAGAWLADNGRKPGDDRTVPLNTY